MPSLIDELVRLQAAADSYRQAAQQLEAERQVRDSAIIDASLAGATRRQVAEITGVTVGRVQQIMDTARSA